MRMARRDARTGRFGGTSSGATGKKKPGIGKLRHGIFKKSTCKAREAKLWHVAVRGSILVNILGFSDRADLSLCFAIGGSLLALPPLSASAGKTLHGVQIATRR
jgi:hypothetical protein